MRNWSSARRHIETILESVPSGVLSLDASRHIVHSNGAVRRLLRLDENAAQSPRRLLRDLFPEDAVADLEHMLRKSGSHGQYHQPDGDRDSAGKSERRGHRGLARSAVAGVA